MFELIIGAIGGVTQGIGSIISSGNQVDIEQAKVQQLAQQLAIEQEKGDNQVFVEALKLKQTQANADLLAAKSEQSGKNIKTILIGFVVALFGFFLYKIISKEEDMARIGISADASQGQLPVNYQRQSIRL